MKRKVAFISVVIVVVLLVFFVSIFADKNQQKSKNTFHEDKLYPVTVATVVHQEFRDEIISVGTLNARKMSPLSSIVAGMVTYVSVDIGDRVKVGDVVIKLNRTNFELAVKQAQAALTVAEASISLAIARFEQAKKEYNRATDLLTDKVIPQSRFEAAETAYKTAKEAASSSRAQHDQAKAALGVQMKHLRDADIRSPIDGVVVERDVEIGQAVAPGGKLLRIINQTFLKLDVNLPEADIGRIAIGTAALITTDAFPEHEFSGKVTVVNPMVDRKTRTFRMRIEIPNPSGKLVDGMFAKVKLSVEKRRSLAIPRNALQRLPGSGTYYVFAVDGNKAYKRTVEIGVTNDQNAEVLNGLVENDKVITSGAGRLRSGTAVIVQDVPNKNETDKSGGTTS
jgi:RND family efflux transporter MFP subunit